MHELSITQSIIRICEEELLKHKIRKVNKVKIVVGELSGLVPDCIHSYFEIASVGTSIEGAELEIEKLPIKIKCNSCSFEGEITKGTYNCPKCDGNNLSIIGGNEFYVDSLEVE